MNDGSNTIRRIHRIDGSCQCTRRDGRKQRKKAILYKKWRWRWRRRRRRRRRRNQHTLRDTALDDPTTDAERTSIHTDQHGNQKAQQPFRTKTTIIQHENINLTHCISNCPISRRSPRGLGRRSRNEEELDSCRGRPRGAVEGVSAPVVIVVAATSGATLLVVKRSGLL